MPVGATGCPGTHKEGGGFDRWQVSAAYGQFDSVLLFEGERRLEVHQEMVTASLGYRLDARWSLQLSVGAVLAGDLAGGGRRYHFRGGPLVALQGSGQLLPADAYPFVLLASLTLGAASSETVEDSAGGDAPTSFTALDLRASVTFGATLWEVWTPYVLLRAFGGPVLWAQGGADITGSDKHHYQVGLGSSFALPAGLALFVDGSFLGERALAAGMSVAF